MDSASHSRPGEEPAPDPVPLVREGALDGSGLAGADAGKGRGGDGLDAVGRTALEGIRVGPEAVALGTCLVAVVVACACFVVGRGVGGGGVEDAEPRGVAG